MFRFLFISFIIFSLITSCEKTGTAFGPPGTLIIPPSQTLPEISLYHVAYGINPLQKLDIHLPRARDVLNTPLLIMVHAGQWISGDKSDMNGYYSWLKAELPAWAFASINYRLVQPSSNKFPTQEQDVEAAINFLMNMADSFKISRKFAVLGESAGGHLALLVSNKMGKQKIKVGIGIGAPSNIENWYQNPINAATRPLLENVTGGTPGQFPLIYQNATVYNFISGNSPKTFLIHGRGDGVIPVSHSIALAEKINSSGPEATLLILENESHNFTAAGQIIIYNSIISFLKDPNLFR